MKLKSILICLLIGYCLSLQAQELKVLEFRADPTMTDATRFPKQDLNGNRCGLIRMGLVLPNASFEGDIISSEYQDGEWWIYMPKDSNWITIKSKTHVPLRYEFEPIQSNVTYVMTVVAITGTGGKPMPTHQYLAFQISPKNAVLEVNGQLWEVDSDGSAMKFVSFGTYNYHVEAPNYHPEKGLVKVNDPENTKTVHVTLKPDFVEVTLKVNADAEIWVNAEKKGIGTWKGSLGKGVYKIECKKNGYESVIITQEITGDMNRQTINLPAPQPIYGSLSIESTPSFATVYIDDVKVGETPKFVNEILVGTHKIRLTKNGYGDFIDTITVKKGERTKAQITLFNNSEIEKQIQSFIEKYSMLAETSDNQLINRLVSELFASDVNRYFNTYDTSREYVAGCFARYDEKFRVIGKHSKVRWNTVSYDLSGDRMYLTYVEDFSIDRLDSSKYSIFVLEKHFELNNDFQIISVYDVQLSKRKK